MYKEEVIEKLKNIPNNLEDTLVTINREIGYGKKVVREDRDDSGVYRVIKEFNENDILLKKSTISNVDENGIYHLQTIEYYRPEGAVGFVDYTEVYDLIYDDEDKLISMARRKEETHE